MKRKPYKKSFKGNRKRKVKLYKRGGIQING